MYILEIVACMEEVKFYKILYFEIYFPNHSMFFDHLLPHSCITFRIASFVGLTCRLNVRPAMLLTSDENLILSLRKSGWFENIIC